MASRGKTSPGKTWQIEISRTAEKQIQRLDRATQEWILDFLRERVQTAQNPRQLGKPLQGDKKGLWRYRVGDYRLICDIIDERITVLVLRVGHRKGLSINRSASNGFNLTKEDLMSAKQAVTIVSRALAVHFLVWLLTELTYLPSNLYSLFHHASPERHGNPLLV